jgi:hypothetical protein
MLNLIKNKYENVTYIILTFEKNHLTICNILKCIKYFYRNV